MRLPDFVRIGIRAVHLVGGTTMPLAVEMPVVLASMEPGTMYFGLLRP